MSMADYYEQCLAETQDAWRKDTEVCHRRIGELEAALKVLYIGAQGVDAELIRRVLDRGKAGV